ncbi:MAG: hypothetical protein BAJALOKI3v1_20037 [Promethearchaeota archaeon]|nr:MAG: hypothetical protein BAJALOKI3v1_20037 [Candidatus Lokiarchaeota archaeon]
MYQFNDKDLELREFISPHYFSLKYKIINQNINFHIQIIKDKQRECRVEKISAKYWN